LPLSGFLQYLLFFFSCRRRHTRFSRDWSSDVCSSDLGVDVVCNGGVLYRHGAEPRAVLSGPPGELILYLMGRRSAARVQLSGDSAAVEALEKAKLGI